MKPKEKLSPVIRIPLEKRFSFSTALQEANSETVQEAIDFLHDSVQSLKSGKIRITVVIDVTQ